MAPESACFVVIVPVSDIAEPLPVGSLRRSGEAAAMLDDLGGRAGEAEGDGSVGEGLNGHWQQAFSVD